MKSKTILQGETQDFIDDMIEYSCQTMQWCSAESEEAARKVGSAITHLMEDAKRISFMSNEAVSLLNEFKLNAARGDAGTKTSGLIKDLQSICSKEKSVMEFANPVIEALQFQDRITQMMSNKVRMIATWALMRSTLKSTDKLSDADRMEFGSRLFECTTMPAERALIRQHIAGLPEEKKVEDAQFF